MAVLLRQPEGVFAAGFSSLRGMPFPGKPDHYPARDEVARYLERYAAALGVEILTRTTVVTVRRESREFAVVTADGRQHRAGGVVAATGSFASPHRPVFPGQETFTGEFLHVADYRSPAAFAGKRVIVAGAGDSAAQVANELAPVATVTLAATHPLRFIPQRVGGKDVHYWLRETGFDSLPATWLDKITGGSVITDSVGFLQTLADGLLEVRPMFAGFDRGHVVWGDGERERADAVILATGYRPSLGYLRQLGALDLQGAPLHSGGISTSHLGLVYLGLGNQRSYASNTLRGVSADADAVIAPLAAWIRDAPRTIGLTTPQIHRTGSPAVIAEESRRIRRPWLSGRAARRMRRTEVTGAPWPGGSFCPDGPGPGLGAHLDGFPGATERRRVGQVQVADFVDGHSWYIAVAAMSMRLAISACRWPNSWIPSSRPVVWSPVPAS